MSSWLRKQVVSDEPAPVFFFQPKQPRARLSIFVLLRTAQAMQHPGEPAGFTPAARPHGGGQPRRSLNDAFGCAGVICNFDAGMRRTVLSAASGIQQGRRRPLVHSLEVFANGTCFADQMRAAIDSLRRAAVTET
jgi:hypothetical protein